MAVTVDGAFLAVTRDLEPIVRPPIANGVRMREPGQYRNEETLSESEKYGTTCRTQQ